MKRIKAADCFALNTRYEGLSHVILEAMALGTPVVTTDVGGNVELFPAERRHWLAHYDKVDHLSALVSQTLEDPSGAGRDAALSAQFVSGMTVARMVEDTVSMLKSIRP